MKIASKNVNKDLIFAKENKDEEKKKRKLIMIDYTEEEKLSMAMNEYNKNEKEVQGSVDSTQGKKLFYFIILLSLFLLLLLCIIDLLFIDFMLQFLFLLIN